MADPTTQATDSSQDVLQQLGLDSIPWPAVFEFLIKVGLALVLMVVAYIVCRIVAGWVTKLLQRVKFDLTITRFLAKVVQWGLFILCFLVILNSFGIETTGFAAAIGGASVAIGLAFQGSLSNVAAGIMLLVFRPYKVGDVIKVNGVVGGVDEIELFFTTLTTPDNRRFYVPNGTIFNGVIENISYYDRRRVDVNIGVGYGADIEETRKVLLKAAQVEHVDEVAIFLDSLGSSSVDWIVRAWAPTPHYWAVREAITSSVKRELDAAGIDIPYPQQVTHIRQEEGVPFQVAGLK